MVTRALEASDITISQYDNLGFDESYSHYQKEWESLFANEFYYDHLTSIAIKGYLKDSTFRSTCWKLFLDCLPKNRDSWIEIAKSQRQQYSEILDKFDSNPRDNQSTDDITVNNPLSLAKQNPWIQYFRDRELRVTIKQDVVRTFPEIEFFHSPEIQSLMTSILFSYAREFPHISYKQGMHELLAPIIYVLYYDKKAYLMASKTDSLDLDIHILLNQNYIEHDAFFIFCNLMKAVESWYTVNDSPNSKYVSLITLEPFSQTPTNSGNPLGQKLKRIYEHLLKKWDIELFGHLEQMEIIPQIYGIRWLRLLFGREFPIDDLLVLWDAIFSDSITFEIVDYIFVAMLISIRELLLRADYSSCLRHLMRFPNSVDVLCIIDLAFQLRKLDNPKKSDGTAVKIESLNPWRAFKGPKNVNRVFTKSVYPGIAKPVKKSHSNVKYHESRPKSLSLASVNSLFGHSTDSSSGGVRPKSSSLSERKGKPDSDDEDVLDGSSLDYLENDLSWTVKRSSCTLPRASIQNVMEIRNDKSDAGEMSANVHDFVDRTFLGNFSETRPRAISSEALCEEMVSLALPSLPAPSATGEYSPKNDNKVSLEEPTKEIIRLRTENFELKAMNEYCFQQITQHIEKLQESMMGQRLMYEDEMFIALAGLKRVRDILRGTVDFSEVIADDINPYSIVFNDIAKDSNKISLSDGQIKKKCDKYINDEKVKDERFEILNDKTVCAQMGNSHEFAKSTVNESESEIKNNTCLSSMTAQNTSVEHSAEDSNSLEK